MSPLNNPLSLEKTFTMVNYPKGTVEEFSKIKNIVAMKEASFDVSKTSEAIEEAKSSSRRIGILTGSDTFILEAMLMGCDGALIGFAGAATAELVRMHKLAQQRLFLIPPAALEPATQ